MNAATGNDMAPVKPPRLKRDWAGRQVRTLVTLRNRIGEVPPGTVLDVVRNHNGLHLATPHCGACGVRFFINGVPERDVQLLPEQPQEEE